MLSDKLPKKLCEDDIFLFFYDLSLPKMYCTSLYVSISCIRGNDELTH
jgi:hypothetical protein